MGVLLFRYQIELRKSSGEDLKLTQEGKSPKAAEERGEETNFQYQLWS